MIRADERTRHHAAAMPRSHASRRRRQRFIFDDEMRAELAEHGEKRLLLIEAFKAWRYHISMPPPIASALADDDGQETAAAFDGHSNGIFETSFDDDG